MCKARFPQCTRPFNWNCATTCISTEMCRGICIITLSYMIIIIHDRLITAAAEIQSLAISYFQLRYTLVSAISWLIKICGPITEFSANLVSCLEHITWKHFLLTIYMYILKIHLTGLLSVLLSSANLIIIKNADALICACQLSNCIKYHRLFRCHFVIRWYSLSVILFFIILLLLLFGNRPTSLESFVLCIGLRTVQLHELLTVK